MRREKNGLFVGKNLYLLANHKSEHLVNDVTYEVHSVFNGSIEETNSITNKIFRIIENESTHLIKASDNDIMDKEYACLTAKR